MTPPTPPDGLSTDPARAATPHETSSDPMPATDRSERATQPSARAAGPQPREIGARPVALVLRVGGVLGVLVVLAGLVTAFSQDSALWTAAGSRGDLLGPRAALRLSDLVGGLRHGQASAVVLLGMVVLAATPAAGVAVAGWYWLRGQRPRLAAVAAVVLVLLAVAGWLGAAG
ncbi:DUF1634 domain-containing protein [Frankia sp. R82]|uniref:DUF1634 domain-containing protein n=1 Tax=Frankia sp. R82 TaxID=2950553 RepID=UPI0020436E26|nr:DUF1634 domain-containing protein [Frankia sp. R82]MCM3886537.1 DUF1634 domain-containing protein [Frankia sp. R82]